MQTDATAAASPGSRYPRQPARNPQHLVKDGQFLSPCLPPPASNPEPTEEAKCARTPAQSGPVFELVHLQPLGQQPPIREQLMPPRFHGKAVLLLPLPLGLRQTQVMAAEPPVRTAPNK